MKTDVFRAPRVLPHFMQAITWFLFRYIILARSLELRGIEDLNNAMDKQRAEKIGLVFAPNHVSEIDPPLSFMGKHPLRGREFPTYFVADTKSEFKKKIRFGWRRYIYGGSIFYVSGAFPIKKNSKNYHTALQKHIDILKSGRDVCIFPEGKMAQGDIRHKAHGGVIYMAEAASTVIVPVAINRTKGANMWDLFLGRGRVVVEYGKMLRPKELIEKAYGEDRYRHAAEHLMGLIEDMRKEAHV